MTADPTTGEALNEEEADILALTKEIMRYYGFTDEQLADAPRRGVPRREPGMHVLGFSRRSSAGPAFDELHATASIVVEVVHPYLAHRVRSAAEEGERRGAEMTSTSRALVSEQLRDPPVSTGRTPGTCRRICDVCGCWNPDGRSCKYDGRWERRDTPKWKNAIGLTPDNARKLAHG